MNDIAFTMLIGSVFILMFSYCNRCINVIKNEKFYNPILKLHIPEEPKI
jgi:hypothetical protein